MISSQFCKSALALGSTALLLGAAPAFALDTYTFKSTAVGAFGSGPYGTVTLTQNGGFVDFSVALRSDLNFIKTGNDNSKSLFAFNASDVSFRDVSDIVFANSLGSTFAAYARASNSPYGKDFSLGIHCTLNCSKGFSRGGYVDPLTFRVANATLGDFGWANSHGASFAADVATNLTSTNNTGAIAVTAIPEPETYALMLAGLAAVGFSVRRRSQV